MRSYSAWLRLPNRLRIRWLSCAPMARSCSRISAPTACSLILRSWELTIPRDWPHSYTVKDGESLWMIAKRWEIYGEGRMWSEIFDANSDVLSDPNMIRPGQTLTIPR